MARYIDADKLLEELQEEIDYETNMYTKEENKWFKIGLKCAYRDVEHQPTADVVPVVRCKDCDFFINYNPDRTYCEQHSDGWGDNRVYVDEDDYCSFGIRK